MIVSVRLPEGLPVPSSLRSSALRSPRESEPTIRYVVPGWSSGRLASGNASTLSTLLQAQSGIAIRKTSHSASSAHSHFSRNRGRPREGLAGLGGFTGFCGGAAGGGEPCRPRDWRAAVGITRVSSSRGCCGIARVSSPLGWPPLLP